MAHAWICWCAAALLTGLPVWAARAPAASRDTETARIEYQIASMLRNAETLLEEKQAERAEKLLESIPRLYPASAGRFEAHLMLGRHYLDKGETDPALKQFIAASSSEDAAEQAEALYRIGICHFNKAEYDRAFSTLRRVTNDYPGSVHANEAYYYIGLCHFKLKRWSKAVEALTKVGTSLGIEDGQVALAEAGQRLFVRLDDQDLVVLGGEDARVLVEAVTTKGDRETIELTPLGQSGVNYVGSIETAAGVAVATNGVLEVQGGDEVELRYVDGQTRDGERGITRRAKVRMVSTATLGFTDGAYREYTDGVFAGQPFFLRVRDLDGDVSAAADRLKVRVRVQYREEKADDSARAGVDLSTEEERLQTRSEAELTLVETGPHTGLFIGGDAVVEWDGEGTPPAGTLVARRGDDIVVEYNDARHIDGEEPSVRAYKARMLMGSIQDVRIEHREVESEDLRARKSLIESRIFLKLGQVFKDVGLQEKADEKAGEGLGLVEEVIRSGFKAGLDRSLIEEAFNVKWDLLLVQNKLNEAIGVCNNLIRLFPNSTLADRALLEIGMAKMESRERGDVEDAKRIFQSVLRLPNSDVKAEAQFRLAEIAEREAIAAFERIKNSTAADRPNMSQALQAYKACAEAYPESSFAAASLEKISSYYIQVKDYRRAIELMEQVFQDYPDASFLDGMLFKWAVAAYRLDDYATAKEKVDRLLFEYPNSEHTEKAVKVLEAVSKKM